MASVNNVLPCGGGYSFLGMLNRESHSVKVRHSMLGVSFIAAVSNNAEKVY